MGYQVNPPTTDELRQLAVQRLGASRAQDFERLTKAQLSKLLEELAINKIEIETQNVYLQDTCASLDVALSECNDLYDFAPIGLLRTDAAGKVSKLNLVAARLLGAERSALKGRALVDLFPPEHRSHIEVQMRGADASGEDQQCEVSLGSEGRVQHVQLTLSPLYTAQGLHIVLNNISASHALQQDLQASVSGWQGAFEQQGDGRWDWDIRSDTLHYCPTLSQRYGRASEPAGGVLEGWRERVHPEDWPALLASIQQCVKGQRTAFQSEHRAWRVGGSWTWTRCCASVFSRDGTGLALRLVGTDSDISERKRIEGEWQEASMVKRALFALLPQYLAVLDADTQVLRTNALWNAYGLANGQPYRDGFAGRAYADLLDVVTGGSEQVKREAMAGIAEVIAGKLPLFQMEYAFGSGSQKRFFIMHVMGVRGAHAYAVVSHQEVTRFKSV